MEKVSYVGNGKVVLIAGGGKVYTDVAARFVRSEKSLEEIITSPYSKEIVSHILESGHKAALEFDYFLFGVEGYSRVTEAQLIRKRMASYMIKSGRQELKGKRAFSVVLPKELAEFKIKVADSYYTGEEIMKLMEAWYNAAVEGGLKEEVARYIKPQATEFKGIIGMNAHALYDFFAIRCCKNAQTEIRDMANKMLALCKQAAPDLFANAGPNCHQLGYCPENRLQNEKCRKAGIPTLYALLTSYYNNKADFHENSPINLYADASGGTAGTDSEGCTVN